MNKLPCSDCGENVLDENFPYYMMYGMIFCVNECVIKNIRRGDEKEKVITQIYQDGRKKQMALFD